MDSKQAQLSRSLPPHEVQAILRVLLQALLQW
jgi:hypothetical protein